MTIYDYMTPFEDKEEATASPASLETPHVDNKTTKPCSCRSTDSSSSDPGSTSSSRRSSNGMHIANGLHADKTCCYVCADMVGATKHEDSGAQSEMMSNRCKHCHS